MSKKAILIGFLFTFAAMAVFGAVISMTTGDHMMMPNCPFKTGQLAMCPMDALTHLAGWQQIFAATVPFALFLGVFLTIRLRTPETQSSPPARLKRSTASHTIVPLALVAAFSHGILHPKLYA